MKAVPTVSSFPWYTYAKNEMIETRIGAVGHSIWNITELMRDLTIHFISTARASSARLIQRSSHAKNLMNLT